MKYILYFTPTGSLTRPKSAPGGFVVKWFDYSPQIIDKMALFWIVFAATHFNQTASKIVSCSNFMIQNPPQSNIEKPNDGLTQNPLTVECLRQLKKGTLKLPTIPDIALKIRQAINDSKTNNNKIAKVVQTDPAITARLIHVANSPLYRGRKKIESCPEALTRLGLTATRNLITSFALKSVFRAKNVIITRRMQKLWEHSSYVAAICAVLAHKTPGFDPDRAILAGLVHDIGVVPILILVDSLLKNPVARQYLDATINQLRGPIGAAVMKQWDFPDDFEDIVINAENWYRNKKPEPDYTDLVIISQLHSFVGKIEIHKCPKMDTLPAYRKLVTGELNADLSMNILENARDEIWQVQQMLSS